MWKESKGIRWRRVRRWIPSKQWHFCGEPPSRRVGTSKTQLGLISLVVFCNSWVCRNQKENMNGIWFGRTDVSIWALDLFTSFGPLCSLLSSVRSVALSATPRPRLLYMWEALDSKLNVRQSEGQGRWRLVPNSQWRILLQLVAFRCIYRLYEWIFYFQSSLLQAHFLLCI